MKIGVKKEVEVDAKVLKIYMKVSDSFCASIVDQDEEELVDYEGYVPDFMPRDDNGNSPHYGDYLILNIDIESGQILNWKKPTTEQLQNFINQDED